jgi:DNA polymerase elongation subunit (family B)
MDTITFDIETIPDPGLSATANEALDKKAKTMSESGRNDLSFEEARKLIAGTTPYFGKIVCIGLHRSGPSGSGSAAFVGEELDILQRFWKTIDQAKFRGLFISYNGLSFDAPFILRRSGLYGLEPTNKNFLSLRRFSNHPHCDLKEVLANWDRFEAITLHLACDFYGVPTPKTGISGKDVEKVFNAGGIQTIADYCVRDVEATFLLYQKLKPYF